MDFLFGLFDSIIAIYLIDFNTFNQKKHKKRYIFGIVVLFIFTLYHCPLNDRGSSLKSFQID